MSKLHAKLSASGSHRWINCPGSVKAEEGIPESTSLFAQEGTAAHELGELVLLNGGSAFDWEDKTLLENNATVVSRDMATFVQQYVDYVLSHKGELLVEQRVCFSDWVEEGFGTCDALIVSGNTLHVVDLKYGKGVRVDAEENTQGILYALGAVSDYGMIHDIQRITISIVQPRLDHISEWELTIDELLSWGERIRQAAELALSGEAPRNAGEKQCQWCKAKARCPELKRVTEQVLLSDFDDMCSPNPDTLSDADLTKAMVNKKLIISWLEAVEQLVMTRLKDGKGFDGYKLVAGRANRAWDSEEKAAIVLSEVLSSDELYTHKIISPAQAEKLLGKKRADLLEGLVVKPEGAPTLVPASDPRPAVNVSSSDFD